MVLFAVSYVGVKLWTRAPLVPYIEMDFQSGLQEVLDASYVIPPKICTASGWFMCQQGGRPPTEELV